jgi:hypothetical protein
MEAATVDAAGYVSYACGYARGGGDVSTYAGHSDLAAAVTDAQACAADPGVRLAWVRGVPPGGDPLGPVLWEPDGYTWAGYEAAGCCTDEWERWNRGGCGTYAVALMRLRPGLRFGTIGRTDLGGGDASGGWWPVHHFAHDDTWAYDAAGRHALPYLGVAPGNDYAELDGDPDDWDDGWGLAGGTAAADIAAAQAHARRNRILDRPPSLLRAAP